MSVDYSLADVCALACAEAFRGDGEILVSPIGTIPTIGARLAKATFSPDLMLTDGVASLVANVVALGETKGQIIEGHMPYRAIFDLVWSGRRHVIMGATQIDRFGNQNIANIGDWAKPKAQLLGVRGAPGNTINHPTSYFVPNHSTKSFVAKVDFVSGVGYDRAAALGPVASRFHEIRRVVSNKAVFDFVSAEKSEGGLRTMQLRSLHPGVTLEDVVANTGFSLVIPADVPTTRGPTEEELHLIRTVIDPKGLGKKELPG